jgi:hypothetical protein
MELIINSMETKHLLETLIVTSASDEIPRLYGTKGFIDVFTRSFHRFLS